MNTKVCTKCGEEKLLTSFYKKKTGKDGLARICIVCWAIKRKERYAKNKDRDQAKNLEWKEKNIDRFKEWHRQNYIEKKATYNKQSTEWMKNHPEFGRYAKSLRRMATPKFANLDKIKEVYKQAASLQKDTGKKFHVDHIVPIKNKIVCGLHVEWNLQILPARENIVKGNKFYV